jgi:radical SAM protein with 4Fe4S-binding SPASM domain
MDQLHSLGTLYLLFSGGEILLRRDLAQLLDHASRRGFGIRIKTTGIGATPETLKAMAEAKVVSVEVSVYSLDHEEHDGVTGMSGSLDGTMAFLESAREAGLFVRAVYTPLGPGPHDLVGDLQRLLDAGFHAAALNYYSQTGCGTSSAHELALGSEGEIDFMKAFLAWRETVVVTHPDPDERVCSAGQLSIYVAPDGSVGPCVDLHQIVVGTVRDEPLETLWARLKQRIDEFNPRWKEIPKCMACKHLKYGRYCGALALAETGVLTEPGQEQCSTCIAIAAAASERGVSRVEE